MPKLELRRLRCCALWFFSISICFAIFCALRYRLAALYNISLSPAPALLAVFPPIRNDGEIKGKTAKRATITFDGAMINGQWQTFSGYGWHYHYKHLSIDNVWCFRWLCVFIQFTMWYTRSPYVCSTHTQCGRMGVDLWRLEPHTHHTHAKGRRPMNERKNSVASTV